MKHGVKKIIGIVLVAPVFILLYVYGFMWLWNTLVTDIFSLRFINFWEALGLLAIAKLIFMTGSGLCGKKCCCSKSKKFRGQDFKSRMREHFTSKYCPKKDCDTPNSEE